jgi:hypothetical protein
MKNQEGGGGGKKQIPRGQHRPQNDSLAPPEWDALKRAPTLDLVKTKRQEVATDILPLVLFVFCCLYCCG